MPPVTTPDAIPGIPGFLGSRASFGMDLVLVGLFALLPILAASIVAVRRRHYGLHRRMQLFIVGALAIALVVFEIDVRVLSDWRVRARADWLPGGNPWWPSGVIAALAVHLVFAVSTFLLISWVTWEAISRFPRPTAPGTHGDRHRRLARIAAIDLVLTAMTGSLFYWMAFVAT